MNDFVTATALFLQTAVQVGTPLLFGTLGGILNEKAGNLNLGIEGMMLMGAVIGFKAAYATGSPGLSIFCAGLAGLLGALIYAFITVSLKGNHVVTGLALTTFGTGFSGFLGLKLVGIALPEKLTQALAPVRVPVLCDIPILGKMFFEQSVYVHLALLCAVLMYLYLYKTGVGLSLRATGENPAAADASGINVALYKYVNILAGGFLCGMGGAFLSIVFVPRWQENITAGMGWIAVALVIFSTWNPAKAIFGAYFFGALKGIGFKIQNLAIPMFGRDVYISSQLLDMLPYLMTIVVLVMITMRKKRENQPPASLGNPYFREDR